MYASIINENIDIENMKKILFTYMYVPEITEIF